MATHRDRARARERRLSGLSNKSAISTVLMQRPIMGKPAGAYNDCIWAHSCCRQNCVNDCYWPYSPESGRSAVPNSSRLIYRLATLKAAYPDTTTLRTLPVCATVDR